MNVGQSRQNQVGLTQPIPLGYAATHHSGRKLGHITKTGGETKTQNQKNSLAAPMGISPRSRNIIHQQEEFLKKQEHIVSSKKIEKVIYLQSWSWFNSKSNLQKSHSNLLCPWDFTVFLSFWGLLLTTKLKPIKPGQAGRWHAEFSGRCAIANPGPGMV